METLDQALARYKQQKNEEQYFKRFPVGLKLPTDLYLKDPLEAIEIIRNRLKYVEDKYADLVVGKDLLLELLSEDLELRGAYKYQFLIHKDQRIIMNFGQMWEELVTQYHEKYLKGKGWQVDNNNKAHYSGDGFEYIPFQDEDELEKIKNAYSEYLDDRNFQSFSEGLEFYLEQKNMTKFQLAMEMDVTPAYVTNIIKERERITPRLVVRIAIAMHLQPRFSKKLMRLAGYDISLNKEYLIYDLLLDHHYNESLEYCDAIIDVLADKDEKKKLKLINTK